MTNEKRKHRDAERRRYIKEMTLKNLKLVENDPQSLSAEKTTNNTEIDINE